MLMHGDDAHRERGCRRHHTHDENPDNSLIVNNIYHDFYSHLSTSQYMSYADTHGIRTTTIPAEILLKRGVHMLLVIQYDGELVSMPGSNGSMSNHHSPCAYVLHNIPSVHDSHRHVVSLSGDYCSDRYLLDTLTKKLSNNLLNETYGCDYRSALKSLPPNPIPLPVLKNGQAQMELEDLFHRQAEAVEFESPEQIMYILLRSLRNRLLQPSSYITDALKRLCSNSKNVTVEQTKWLKYLLAEIVSLNQSSSTPSCNVAQYDGAKRSLGSCVCVLCAQRSRLTICE